MAVTPEKIAVALGVTAPEDDDAAYEQWKMWIADALMLIENRATQLDVDMDDLDEAKVDYVVRQAVVAYIKRPDDATQVTITVDDGTTSKLYRSGTGEVTIRDEWWTLLGLTDPDGAFAIDMLGTSTAHLLWCSLMFGADYCSCGVDIAGTPIFEGG